MRVVDLGEVGMKKLLCAISLIFSQMCFADYIVVKGDKLPYQELTKEEFDQVSKILNKYQFPMCLGYISEYRKSMKEKYFHFRKTAEPFKYYEKVPSISGKMAKKQLQKWDPEKLKEQFEEKNSAEGTRKRTYVEYPQSIFYDPSLGDLTQAEINELCELGEQEFLQKKITEINPEFKLIFVPKTMYEYLFFVVFLRNLKDLIAHPDIIDLQKQIKEESDLTSAKKKQLEEDLRNKLIDLFNNTKYALASIILVNSNFFKKDSRDERIIKDKNIIFYLNNKIVEELNNKNLGEITSDSIEELVNSSCEFCSLLKEVAPFSEIFFDILSVPNYWKNVRKGFVRKHFDQELQKRQSLCVPGAFIKEEFETHNKNEFLLYREFSSIVNEDDGALFLDKIIKILPEFTLLHDINDYGISYGNSLYAGFFRDPTACVIYFPLCEKRSVYALKINECNFVKNKKSFVRRHLIIPPLNTIEGLLSKGELFHSRLMTLDPGVLRRKTKNKNLPTKKELDIEKEYQDYLQENAVILNKTDDKFISYEEWYEQNESKPKEK
ncbi:MAG: hypothetical protein UR26_C0002G0097 [candidate division TM6 bacterium GW2011_GWF2_32_72]|nr:MAG: hypothetical protein UR26_C0002G0097 [candidate division TM6 bacterium GW2011_GWF2_32_72]